MSTKNFEDGVLVILEIIGPGGNRQMKPEDLGLTAAQIPPKDLASLGAFHLYTKDDVRPFDTLRKEGQNICAKVGHALREGVYLIDIDDYPEVEKSLDDVQTRYNAISAEFQADVAGKIQKTMDAHPEWAHMISKRGVPQDVRPTFGWYPKPMGNSAKAKRIAKKFVTRAAETLADRVWGSVVDSAQKIEESLANRDQVRARALNSLRDLVRRMNGALLIADARLAPVAVTARDLIESLNGLELVGKGDMMRVYGLLHVLTDEERLKSHCGIGRQVQNDEPGDDAEPVIPAIPAAEAATNDNMADGAGSETAGENGDQGDDDESLPPVVLPQQQAKRPVVIRF